jgi:two-component system, NtrC family, response regulator AtoC
MKPRILLVDDERVFRVLAEEALVREGFDVRTAGTLARARQELEQSVPDVVVLDRRLPDGEGMHLLTEVGAQAGSGPLFIVVTAYGDVQNAVEAIRAGAVDYLVKPVQPTDLVMKLRKVLELRGLRDLLLLAKGVQREPAQSKSENARAVESTLQRVSQSPLTPVFLVGASGSGKQFAAERLHALTYPPDGAEAPFVDVNCAALPSNLVESELFGHERGAFTDARGARRGLIEMADGGTLFLDEVTELSDASQAKLLKFLDSLRFRRLGGEREYEVRLRVVAATNHDIERLVQLGKFRGDLYHRLSVIMVRIPSLAERKEDLPELAEFFLRQCAARVKKRVDGFSRPALNALLGYAFPGNVRELRNIIERAVILAAGPQIGPADIVLSERLPSSMPSAPFFSVELTGNGHPPSTHEVERAYVLRVLDHMAGRRVAAAQALGVSYPTFLKRLRSLGIGEDG